MTKPTLEELRSEYSRKCDKTAFPIRDALIAALETELGEWMTIALDAAYAAERQYDFNVEQIAKQAALEQRVKELSSNSNSGTTGHALGYDCRLETERLRNRAEQAEAENSVVATAVLELCRKHGCKDLDELESRFDEGMERLMQTEDALAHLRDEYDGYKVLSERRLEEAEAALADEKEHRTDLAEALHSVKLIARAEREENERVRWMLDSLAIDHIEDLAQRDLHTSYQRLMAGLADRWTRRGEGE